MVRFTGTPLIAVGANLVGNNGGRNIQVAGSDKALFVGHPSGDVLFWLIRSICGPVEQDGTMLTLTSTDASDVLGPTTSFDRNSASPAANDGLGRVLFNGKTSMEAIRNWCRTNRPLLRPAGSGRRGFFREP